MVFIKKITNDENGQLLVVAGIIISLLIVVSSIVTINLASTTKPVDKTDFIKSDFDNVKEKFGYLLDDRLTPSMLNDQNILNNVFYNATNEFRFSLIRHDFYFNATLEGITLNEDTPNGLYANLTLSNRHDIVSEQVFYYIT